MMIAMVSKKILFPPCLKIMTIYWHFSFLKRYDVHLHLDDSSKKSTLEKKDKKLQEEEEPPKEDGDDDKKAAKQGSAQKGEFSTYRK